MRTTKKTAIDWLLPEVRKEVLSLLLTNPEQSWHLRDIARKTGFAPGTLQRELTGLAQAEIVLKRKDGNRMYYQANKTCPIFPELSSLLRKTAGLADILKNALKPLSKKIRAAFVYGSFAADSFKANSDVDLMVIGSCSFREVVAAMGKPQEVLSREINPSVYPAEEFRTKTAEGHHFLKTVLASPKVFLIGNEHELEELA
jgi:DNA-binding transcriptional ArsR family regulator